MVKYNAEWDITFESYHQYHMEVLLEIPRRSCQFGKNEIGMDAILTAVMDINRVFLRPKLSETGPARNAPTNAAT